MPSDDAASSLIWLALRNITAEQPTATPGLQAAIDLLSQTLTSAGGPAPGFHIDPARKHRPLNRFDPISLTLHRADRVRAFESQRHTTKPWLFT